MTTEQVKEQLQNRKRNRENGLPGVFKRSGGDDRSGKLL